MIKILNSPISIEISGFFNVNVATEILNVSYRSSRLFKYSYAYEILIIYGDIFELIKNNTLVIA